MSSETDWSLNFSFDLFKMLPKVLKWTFWKFNQKVLQRLPKFAKDQYKTFYAYIFDYI